MAMSIFPILFLIYLLVWITSFVDSGYLKSEKEAKDIYIYIVNVAMVFSILLMPPIGYAADKLNLRVMVPLSFFLRACVGTAFMFFVHTPDSPWTLVVVLCLITCTVMENIMIQKLFMSTLPDDIRGTMFGVFGLFS